MKTYRGLIDKLEPHQVFVFGSNVHGWHGSGNAAVARHLFGAKQGKPRGLQGQSYGIVTKDLTKKNHPSVSARSVKLQIISLYEFAKKNPEMEFFVAYTSKGHLLSGFTHQQIASFFSCVLIPPNIVFEEGFSKLLTI